MSTHSHSARDMHGSCAILVEACTPLVYRHNSFRISGLPVDATAREIKRRIDDLKHADEFGDAAEEHTHAFALNPPPELARIREAAQRLHDPERRVIEELFWFWPEEWGKGRHDPALIALANGKKDEAFSLWSKGLSDSGSVVSVIAKHNLAVMYQLVALDSEHVALETDLSQEQQATIEEYWRTCFKWWEELTDDEVFWSIITERIRMLDDPRLTTGFARRMRATLPEAMDRINAMLALGFIERGKHNLAEKHITYMIETHAGQDDVPKTMALVTKPLFSRVRSALEHADKAAASDPEQADGAAIDLLNIATPAFSTLQRFLPEDHTEFNDVRDAVVDTCLRCHVAFLRESKKWKAKWDIAIEILDKVIAIAPAGEVHSTIAEARQSAVHGKALAHPKAKAVQDLVARSGSEELPQRLRTLGSEVAQALHSLQAEVGGKADSFTACADLVAGALRSLSVELVNTGQQQMEPVLKFFADESNRILHSRALAAGMRQAVDLERRKWDALVNVAIGIDLYDQGRKLAKSEELQQRFTQDAEAVNNLRAFCSQVTDLAGKKRERGLIFNWWLPPTQKASTPPPVPRKSTAQATATSSSSSCFVATAVYGSCSHPSVVALRHFRDTHLSHLFIGRLFISFYYRVGPLLAIPVSRSSRLRSACRRLLDVAVLRVWQHERTSSSDHSRNGGQI